MNGLKRVAAEALNHLSPEVARAWTHRISDELAPWTDGIDSRRLAGLGSSKPELQPYQIRRGRLYRLPRSQVLEIPWLERARTEYERCLQILMARSGNEDWPDMDWVMNMGDHPVRGEPVFSTWVRDGDDNPRWPSSAHWPGMGADDSSGTTIRGHRVFSTGALQRPWRERRAIVGWRGTATGMYDHHFRWSRWTEKLGWPVGRGKTRLDLCRIVKPYPDRFDVAITGWQQVSGERGCWLAQRFPTAVWVEQDWFLGQRFVLNVDGNVSTWSFLTQLGTGSVVLRQESPYSDFCAPMLEAGIHYVPVARDLRDLPEVARCCLEDEAGMHRIAAQASEWIARWLTADSVDAYMLGLMAAYAELCLNDGKIAEGAKLVHGGNCS